MVSLLLTFVLSFAPAIITVIVTSAAVAIPRFVILPVMTSLSVSAAASTTTPVPTMRRTAMAAALLIASFTRSAAAPTPVVTLTAVPSPLCSIVIMKPIFHFPIVTSVVALVMMVAMSWSIGSFLWLGLMVSAMAVASRMRRFPSPLRWTIGRTANISTSSGPKPTSCASLTTTAHTTSSFNTVVATTCTCTTSFPLRILIPYLRNTLGKVNLDPSIIDEGVIHLKVCLIALLLGGKFHKCITQ
mmetsp:Transcript_35389/g.77588  ORF Transcript_35389/g.77588 Transcript_35389/m.77588 type:complete len:244 (+) Transcript_35389:117-848(+)